MLNRCRRAGLVILLLAVVVCPLSRGGLATDQDDENPKAEGVRALIAEWVKVRDLISKERNDWAVAEAMLNDQKALRQKEIEDLEKSTREAEAGIGDLEEKKIKLDRELGDLNEAAKMVERTVTAYELRIEKLLKRLPDPIRDRVKPLSQQIPDDPKNAKTSLGTRFRNVIGILNDINKFNRDITVTSEVRSLPDGSTVEVTSMYVGIGQGYYVSPDGKAAGVGRPSADGWSWTPANDAAAEIARAIAIYKNEEVASFVQLPIRID